MTEAQKIMAVLEAIGIIVSDMARGALIVVPVLLVVMIILKQVFGISTKKLLYRWIGLK